jgi:hypothetical protein
MRFTKTKGMGYTFVSQGMYIIQGVTMHNVCSVKQLLSLSKE